MVNKLKKAGLMFCVLTLLNSTSESQVVLQVDFTGNVLPAGWYEDSSGFIPVISGWKFSGIPNGVFGAGFDTDYIRGYTGGMDNSLISASFDASGLSSAYLSFGEWYGGGSSGNYYIRVEASNDGGNTWNPVFFNYSYGHMNWYLNARRKVIDLTQYIAGSPNARIRFHRYNAGSWALDSIIVSNNEPCTMPTDTTGLAASTLSVCCTGSDVHLRIDNLSRGTGQTYQWQYKNATTGNVYTDITGAVYDTVTFTQNGNTYYQCLVTCQSSNTEATQELLINDTPPSGATITRNIMNYHGLCPSAVDTLVFDGEKGIAGVGYQWKSAPGSSGPYTNIVGANDTLYVASYANFTSTTYFKCQQLCLSNGNAYTTPSFTEYLNENPYCYCLMYNFNYCPGTGPFGGNITNVTIPGTPLSNAASVCNNVMGPNNNYLFLSPTVSNYTALLTRNTSYTISVTNDSIEPHIFVMWLDYNSNGEFDSSEYTFIIHNLDTNATATANFFVPANAVPGLTGLRVRAFAAGDPYNGNSACWGYFGGQTQDYMVTIDTTVSISWEQGVQSSEIIVYPNPATKELTVGSDSWQEESTIYITDITGKTILNSKFETRNLKVNISALTPGIYFVKLQTGSGTAVKKFVKQ